MAANKTLTAKVLTVSTYELNTDRTGEFKVLEFSNGLILVPGETTHDWFFEDRDSVDGCGNDVVSSIEETGESEEWTTKELLNSIQGSMKEFGIDSVPSKHRELWAND